MQSVRQQLARQFSSLPLAFLLISLTGCGGGGGSTASAPLSFSDGSASSFFDSAFAARLFESIDGEGEPWLGLVDADSAILKLGSNSQDTNAILSKLPEADEDISVTKNYSMLNYYPGASNSINDPGRYAVLGRLTPPSAIEGDDIQPMRFDMSGHWTCVKCIDNDALRQGDLKGYLDVNFADVNADLSLSGDGLSLTSTLSLAKNSELSGNQHPTVTLDGITINPIRSQIIGGLFGPDINEAGVVFGVVGNQGKTISGSAISD